MTMNIRKKIGWFLENTNALYIHKEERIFKYKTLLLDNADIGVTNERHCDREIVVSLTSYGERINDYNPQNEMFMGLKRNVPKPKTKCYFQSYPRPSSCYGSHTTKKPSYTDGFFFFTMFADFQAALGTFVYSIMSV